MHAADVKDRDTIYVNTNIPASLPPVPKQPIRTPATVSVTYAEPILENPSEWQLSIVRFTCPTALVPIFIARPQGGGGAIPFAFRGLATFGSNLITGVPSTAGISAGMGINNGSPAFTSTVTAVSSTTVQMLAVWPGATGIQTFNVYTLIPLQTNPNAMIYSVSLKALGGPVRQAFIPWFPDFTPDIAPVPTLPLDPNTGLPSVPNPETHPEEYNKFLVDNVLYYSCTAYRHFLNAINLAFAAAFAVASLDPGWPVGATFPPYMTFNTATEQFSLTAQDAYDYLPSPGPAQIFFNCALWDFFRPTLHGIESICHGPADPDYGADVQLLISNYGFGTTLSQIPNPTAPPGTSGLILSQEFPALQLWSDLAGISITAQGIPLATEYAPATSASTVAGAGGDAIVTDYFPVPTGAGFDTRTEITYVPSGEYRLSDMIGTSSISRLGLAVYWSDVAGNRFPLYVSSVPCNVKIMFRRKAHGHEFSAPIKSIGPPMEGGCGVCLSGGCEYCSSESGGARPRKSLFASKRR